MAIRRGSSRLGHARRGTGGNVSEGEPSAADVPDGLLGEASPAGRWTARERRGEAVEAQERFEPGSCRPRVC